MKILIFSDTHGNNKRMMEIALQNPDADLVLHLGDNVRDAMKLNESTPVKVLWVKGNTDHVNEKEDLILEVEGYKIFLTHGHLYGIKSGLQNLYYKCKQEGADIALFGHSHIAVNEEIGGIVFLNPGSIGDKRSQKYHSYGILQLENGVIDTRIVYVK